MQPPLRSFLLVCFLASSITPCLCDGPVYSESSWSILSVNCLFIAVMCVFLLDLRSTALVPFIVSIAGAIANGLCFYAYYQTSQYSTNQILAAAGVADVMWGIQEIGLSFYSFFILRRTLTHTATKPDKAVYYALFSVFCVGAAAIRVAILVYRQLLLKNGTADQTTINNLHISYFTLIACLESTNAWFLIKSFAQTRLHTNNSHRLFRTIVQSSEVRLALLFAIGICRAVTYSYQTQPQAADSAATQLDRFVYAAECFFPVVFIVDRLATRAAASASKPGGTSLVSGDDTAASRSDRNDTASSPGARARQTVVISASPGTNATNGGSAGNVPRKDSAKLSNNLKVTNSTIGPSSLVYSFPHAYGNRNSTHMSPTIANPERTTGSPSTNVKNMNVQLAMNPSTGAADSAEGAAASTSAAETTPPLETVSLHIGDHE